MQQALKHYSVAFMSDAHHGRLGICDAWLPPANLDAPGERERILCVILGERFELEDIEDARGLNCFESAVVVESAAAPRDPDNVVFRTTMKRWEVIEGQSPWEHEPAFELLVRQSNGGQGGLSIDVHPVNDDLDAHPAPPRLGAAVEINNGVPCMHLYAGPSGEVAQSIFAIPGDKLAVRPGDSADWIYHQSADFTIPEGQQKLIGQAVSAFSRTNGQGSEPVSETVKTSERGG